MTQAGEGMAAREDITRIKQFRDQLRPHNIEVWSSSESVPEEILQQLVQSDEDFMSDDPRAEELHPIQQIGNEEELPSETPRIRISHFVDGSPRTVNTGFLLGTSGIAYPVALSHVGAASVIFDDKRWRETGFADAYLILASVNTGMGLDIELSGKWKLEDPIDQPGGKKIKFTDTVEMRGAAVRRARRRMRECEKRLVCQLSDDFPEEWVAIDGTLFEIEGHAELMKDRKVIGISKSFTLDPIVMKGSTQERMGHLIKTLTNLSVGSRSPVYKLVPEKNRHEKYTYMWFVRIHEARQSPVSGIVKLELPPSKYYLNVDLRVQTIDAISHAIFRLRNPYLFDNRRGESFLYPIYVAESVIKSKLTSVERIRGIWESSRY